MPGRISRCQVALILLSSVMVPAGYGQQTYVSKFDAFVGWTYLNSPKIGLGEPGYHIQVGMRPRTWYSLGFDYANARGDLTLTPGLLPTELQTTLGGILGQLAAAGRLPPGYQLMVVARSETQTFAAGPQLAFRHWKPVTLFVRPSLGAIREVAIPKPTDAIQTLIVNRLAPEGRKRDWQGFYGVGGGFDLNFSKHMALRVQADWVYDHLFNDLLREGRSTVRFSIGPAFNFGPNIIK